MRTTTKIKPQLVLITSGIILFTALIVFGRTVPQKDKPVETQPVTAGVLSFQEILAQYKQNLKPDQADRLLKLENSVVRGDIREQQIHAYHQLARFWKDSVPAFEPYVFYTAEAAKLENSEKSLTFAAHLMESRLMETEHPAMQTWLATNAKDLFEQALKLNPSNDSSKIGLAACYLFGNIAGNPMKQGIEPIRAIAEKDPDNIYAQKVLAIGALKTNQIDKAIERLNIIVKKEPGNMEMIFRLAEAYETKGDKVNAVAQYRLLKEIVPYPEVKAEIQQRIDNLNK